MPFYFAVEFGSIREKVVRCLWRKFSCPCNQAREVRVCPSCLKQMDHPKLFLLKIIQSNLVLFFANYCLSISGDFRMSFGEDRNKVKNIVRPQVDRFRELYSSFWPALSAYAEFNPSTGRCEQDTSPLARMYHLNLLPKKIQVNRIFFFLLSFLRLFLLRESLHFKQNRFPPSFPKDSGNCRERNVFESGNFHAERQTSARCEGTQT